MQQELSFSILRIIVRSQTSVCRFIGTQGGEPATKGCTVTSGNYTQAWSTILCPVSVFAFSLCTVLIISITGTHKDLVKYESEYPESVKNILEGIKSGRLKFCPSASTPEERLALERRLKTLYAEKRHKDHFEIFLDKTIPRSSRKINHDDIQTLLSGLGGVWIRGLPPTIGASGKGDAMRVRISVHSVDPLIKKKLGPHARNINAHECIWRGKEFCDHFKWGSGPSHSSLMLLSLLVGKFCYITHYLASSSRIFSYFQFLACDSRYVTASPVCSTSNSTNS